MKIVFANNYLNHHERYISEALYRMPNVEFYFIQTKEIEKSRVQMGWQDMSDAPFCICSYKNKENHDLALKLCFEADALILGGAPNEFFRKRVKANKLTFFYCERLFRNGVWHMLNPRTFITVLNRFILPGIKSNVHMLCASAYTAMDCYKIFAYRGKYYKWGHFINVNTIVDDNVSMSVKNNSLRNKKSISILWVGRFLRLKHPEMAVELANTLKKKNIPFTLDIIGSGEMEKELRNMITHYNLSDSVKMLGTMNPSKVREHMENSDIFLFTSDFNEGWGAVLGEALASGCAVVTSHGIGATPFLAKHQENSLVYETGNYDSFERNVLKLVESEYLRQRLSRNALKTMNEIWNPLEAAKRFVQVVETFMKHGEMIYFNDGPLSKAELLNNNWFKDDTI